MTGAEAFAALASAETGAASDAAAASRADAIAAMASQQAASQPQVAFADLLAGGLEGVEQKLAHADDLTRRFALNEDIPIHQVTIALEEARLAMELAMQVRTRLVEGYREIMNMQL